MISGRGSEVHVSISSQAISIASTQMEVPNAKTQSFELAVSNPPHYLLAIRDLLQWVGFSQIYCLTFGSLSSLLALASFPSPSPIALAFLSLLAFLAS